MSGYYYPPSKGTHRYGHVFDTIGYLGHNENVDNPYQNIFKIDHPYYYQPWDKYQDIFAGMNRMKTLSFSFDAEALGLETKRIIFGFNSTTHNCEVRAEVGDCRHWIP